MKSEACEHESEQGEKACERSNQLSDEKPAQSKKNRSRKPSVTSKATNALIIFVMAVVIGIAAFFVYKLIIDSDIRNKDNWKTVEKQEYSISVPKAMQESEDDIEIDSDYTKLGFFRCSKASVYISKAEFNEEEKNQIRSEGLEVIKNQMLKNGEKKEINGYRLNPQQRGELIFVEYPVSAKDIVKGEEKLWVVSATLVTNQCIYQVDAYCASDDAEDYEGAMVGWLETFKIK